MRTLIHLLKKEFKQMFRDPAILRLIFLLPVIQLLILPWAADYEIKNINVAIVDHDHSSYSHDLIRKIQYSAYFKLIGTTPSYEKALECIEKETADLLIEIPPGFEKDLVRHSEGHILVAINAVNGAKGGLGGQYINGIIRQFNQQVRLDWVQWPRLNPIPIVDITYSHRYNKSMNYQIFMVPGILGLLLTLVGGFLAALNIVKEKEIGTIEQLNVSPIRKHHFILGKLIPFWILGLVILTIGLGVSYVAYGIVPQGNLMVLYGFAALYLLAVMGFGLLISTYSNTQQQAMLVTFFFMLIFILLSGLYTPIESMPPWAKFIAQLNPVTYLVDVMRMVILKGSTFQQILPHIGIISIFAILLNSWAVLNYRKMT